MEQLRDLFEVWAIQYNKDVEALKKQESGIDADYIINLLNETDD